jgi:hypothetical protein
MPRPDQLNRLRATWQRRTSSARLVRRSVLAAALILVATLFAWQLRTAADNRAIGNGPKLHIAERPVPAPINDAVVDSKDDSPASVQKATIDSPSLPEIRPLPTEASSLEQLLVLSAGRQRKELKPAKADPKEIDQLDEAVEALANGTTTLEEVVRSVAPQAALAEQQLITLAGQTNAYRQLAIVRLLAVIGTPRSLPILMELRKTPELRDEATRGIVRLAAPIVLARLAIQETDAKVQKQLLAALLERDSREAVDLFLNLASNPLTTRAALDCLSSVKEAPVDLLVENLHAPKVSRRLIAARVLGGLCDTSVSQRLIAMAVQGDSRREALVALLSSCDPQASQFLKSGYRDPNWAALIQAAESDVRPLTFHYEET